jgi:hypothetical protein
MLRLFTFIIACCLLYLVASSFMESKNTENKTAGTPPVTTSSPAGTEISSPKEPEETTSTTEEAESAIPQGTNTVTGSVGSTREEIDRERARRAQQLNSKQNQDESGSSRLGTKESSAQADGPRYSKEDAWHYTVQAENDLSALEKLLTK